MTIYLLTFFFSYVLCLWGEIWIKNNRHIKVARFLLFISVVCVSLMAGLRENSIGSDTISYTTYYIEYGSRFYTLKDFMNFFVVYEPGFNVFSYFIGTLFNHSSHWFLFWCAMIIYGFTMKTFYYYRNNCSMSMAWLFFLMVNCTEALNITRNYMALALAAYAFCFVFDENSKKFLMLTIIAMTFHLSAAFNFVLFLLYKGLRQFNTRWYKILVVMGTIITLFMYPYIFRMLSAFSFVGAKTEGYLYFTEFSIQWNPLLIRLPFFFLILLNKKNFCESHPVKTDGKYSGRDVFGDFCFLVVIIELILSQLRGFSVTLYRFTLYVAVLKYVSYSRALDLSRFRVNRVFTHVIAYAYMIIVFIYWVVILNSGHIYPYVSEILGIGG